MLEKAAVRIFLVDLNQLVSDTELLQTCFSALDSHEVARRNRFSTLELRNRFTLVRGILRQLLGKHLGVPANRVEIVYNAYGRPGLKEPFNQQLQFNLSYSSHLALIALSRDLQIGVDIEKIQPIPEMDAIVSRWFSLLELDAWKRLQPDERLQGFYNGWTRKEAFIKATGLGLSYPLKQFSVTLTPSLPPRLVEVAGCTDHPWQLHDISPNTRFAAALATHGVPGTLHYQNWHGT